MWDLRKRRPTSLAETIAHETDGVLDHDKAQEYTSLDVTFATNDAEIEFFALSKPLPEE